MRFTIVIGSLLGLALAAGAQSREVTIYRDAKGVPHIVGEDSAAVMYGLGYALAQDRLAEFELVRRGVYGRRAEILGAKSVTADGVARDRLLPAAELMRMYHAIPVEHQVMMQRFVDGMNREIAEIASDPEHKLPYQFKQWGITPQPWTLLDYLARIAALPNGRSGYELDNLAFLNAMTARYGVATGRKIFEDVVPLSDPDSPTTIPAGEDLAPLQPMPKPGTYYGAPTASAMGGSSPATAREAFRPPVELQTEASRCLVIGPSRSASGHVLMMEATADGPESHLYGGGFDSAGFALPGWGPPTMGRSAEHGWLLTSGHADTTDTFAERLDPHETHRYWFKGAWRKMQVRTEIIAVKGAPPVKHEVALTVHGPVVKWDVEHGVAYTQRYAERGKELDNWVGGIEMARAKTLADFESKGVARLSWNLGVCYGDSAGQIAFWEAGLLPKRAEGADSRLPTPGTGEYEWNGFLKFDEQPHMLNPKQGFIHTWNSKATSWMREGDEARIGKTFRTYLGTQLASSSHAITLLDMREFNRKIFNALGAQDLTQTSPAFFAPYLQAAVDRSDDAEVKQALQLMLAFNGLYEDLDGDGFYDSPGLPLFRAWLQHAPQVVFGPTMDDWWSKIDAERYEKYQSSLLLRALQGSAAGLPLQYDYFAGRNRDAVIVQSIRETIDSLRPRFAGRPMTEWHLPIFWKYFDPSRMTPDKPVLPGSEEPRARVSAALGLSPYVVKHHGGEEWVGLMELVPAHPVLYTVVEAGGQNLFIGPDGKGNPNLTDQTMMHANNELKRIDLSIEEVKQHAASVEKLDY